MSKLHMTEDEITRSYRNSSNPDKHIKILCELNSCSKQIIIDILHSYNLVDDKGKKVPNPVILFNRSLNYQVDSTTPNDIESSTVTSLVEGVDAMSDITHRRSRTTFDDDTLYQIALMVSSGKTNDVIAAAFGTSPQSLSNLLSRKGINRQNVDNWLEHRADSVYNNTTLVAEIKQQPASTVDFSLISSKLALLRELSDEMYSSPNLMVFGRMHQLIIDIELQVKSCQ